MAFHIEQIFAQVEHHYDREGDVLELSFGPPRPAVAIQVEDWLALRLAIGRPPGFVGMTIVGFKDIRDKIRRYVEDEIDVDEDLADRVEALRRVSVVYDDISDTLIMRAEEDDAEGLSIFEPLVDDVVYLEKRIPTKDVLGIKIVNFTRAGPAAVEAMIGRLIDAIFEPAPPTDENTRLFTRAVMTSVGRSLANIAA
jgi:hypothetical protein